jgi:HEAT repeat protein
VIRYRAEELIVRSLAICLLISVIISLAGATEAKSSDLELAALLKAASSYEPGESREALAKIDDVVRQSLNREAERGPVAAAMAEALGQDGSWAYKDFLCRWLSVIGTPREVRGLAQLVTSETIGDMALYALARIPGEASDKALLDVLRETAGNRRLAVIHNLGERRTESAVPTLARLLGEGDRAVSEAAAAALAIIGGESAARILLGEFARSDPQRRTVLGDACLTVASGLGNSEQAKDLYQRVYELAPDERLRTAAFLGLVRQDPRETVALVVEYLAAESKSLRRAAAGLVREMPGEEATASFCSALKSLTPENQWLLLHALGDRGDSRALPVLHTAAASAYAEVRIAAIRSMGLLGGASEVGWLAKAAAKSEGVEQETARNSLVGLKGADIDERIVLELRNQKLAVVRAELARSLGARKAVEAVPALFRAARDRDLSVRLEAMKSLGATATLQDMAALVRLLTSNGGDVERQEMEKAVVATSRRMPGTGVGVEPVIAALAAVSDPRVKTSLLTVLGRMHGPQALEAVQKALDDRDADVRFSAMRSLSNWENTEALELLLEYAQTGVEAHRVLALRGYIRLLGLSPHNDEQKLMGYQKAIILASADQEKKQALSGLGSVTTLDALRFAVSFLNDPGICEEAGAAATQIATVIADIHPTETERAMAKVLQAAKNENTRRIARLAGSPEGQTRAAARRFQREGISTTR